MLEFFTKMSLLFFIQTQSLHFFNKTSYNTCFIKACPYQETVAQVTLKIVILMLTALILHKNRTREDYEKSQSVLPVNFSFLFDFLLEFAIPLFENLMFYIPF